MMQQYKRPKRSTSPILPNFEPSGLLEIESKNKEETIIKHVEPADAETPAHYYARLHTPQNKRTIYQLIQYKDATLQHTYDLTTKSSFLIGRNMEKKDEEVLADIPIPLQSCSKQHCILQFRCKNDSLIPYVMDLNSANGTLLNDTPLPVQRYVELQSQDILLFSDADEHYELIFVAA